MDIKAVIILSVIIVISVVCNLFAIFFIRYNVKKTKKEVTLKEKLVFLLCTLNLCNIIGYNIELHAAIVGETKETECQTQGFIICFCTYSNIGYFVSLTLERYISILYPFLSEEWYSHKSKAAMFMFLPVFGGAILGTSPLVGWGTYGRSREHKHVLFVSI